ncbi:MAG: DUF2442 domain-containing protein [Mucilaginibacter sp.]
MSTIDIIEIKDIRFIESDTMFIALSNERSFLVPLDKFPAIAALSAEEKNDFEIIDGANVSFLAIDEIYNIHELVGF